MWMGTCPATQGTTSHIPAWIHPDPHARRVLCDPWPYWTMCGPVVTSKRRLELLYDARNLYRSLMYRCISVIIVNDLVIHDDHRATATNQQVIHLASRGRISLWSLGVAMDSHVMAYLLWCFYFWNCLFFVFVHDFSRYSALHSLYYCTINVYAAFIQVTRKLRKKRHLYYDLRPCSFHSSQHGALIHSHLHQFQHQRAKTKTPPLLLLNSYWEPRHSWHYGLDLSRYCI